MLPLALPKPAIHKSEILAEDTMHCLWSVLTWPMQHMYCGKFLEKAADGKDWQHKSPRGQKAGTLLNSAGLCGMIFAITADGRFFQNEYRLPGSSHAECCWCCGANRPSHPHNDYRPGAKWRETIKNHKDSNPTDHLIMTVPGINGYIGISWSWVLQPTLWPTSCLTWWWKQNCHAALLKPGWRNFLENCLAYTMSWAQIPATRWEDFMCPLSASPTRSGAILLSSQVWEQNRWDASSLHSWNSARIWLMRALTKSTGLLECIRNLNRMYEAMKCQGLHPDESAYEQHKRSTEKCLLNYSKPAKIATSQNILQWNIAHKHHLACHMPEQFRHLNCRFVSTYSGETMVGFMVASLGHACLTLLHIWCLQRLLGDIDWDCIWGWHMVTLTWWILKKNCGSSKRAASVLQKGCLWSCKRATSLTLLHCALGKGSSCLSNNTCWPHGCEKPKFETNKVCTF